MAIAKSNKTTKENKTTCTMCTRALSPMNFWESESIVNKNGKLHICSDCINELFDLFYRENRGYGNDFIVDGNSIVFDKTTEDITKEVCRYIDLSFNYDAYYAWEKHVTKNKEESGTRKINKVFGIYKSKLSSTAKQNGISGTTYKFSDNPDKILKEEENRKQKIKNEIGSSKKNKSSCEITELDIKNKEDVIRMVGYDPFEYEPESNNKKQLYNKLVDFLDDSTLEDSFKLPIVIEIVTSLNQIDSLNQAISMITSDIKGLVENKADVKSLVESKNKMYSSILSMAKDNGISVNHNNSKSKGAGTLSGIIKKLQELGFEESDINLFDIETIGGIKQVADISNASIISQLLLDENDYTEMIIEQREMLVKLTENLEITQEENRKLKVKLASMVGG